MPRTRSIADLHKELAVKEGQLAKLRTQRDKLARQLTGIEREIAVLGGRPVKIKRKGRRKVAARKGRRARGGPSLADVLARVMADKGNVKVAEAAKLALGAGYKSKSSQFANIVSQTLSADKRFKKIARGIYALKGGGRAAVKRTKKKVAKKTPAERGKPAKKRAAKKPAAKKTPRGPAKKAVRAGSLRDILVKVMSGKDAVTVAEAQTAVLDAGYKTKAKDFRFIVNKTLAKDDLFKNVGRGRYALKG